jgi:hypothetical protein
MGQYTGWQEIILSKFKTIHVTCSKLGYNYYSKSYTTIKRLLFHKYVTFLHDSTYIVHLQAGGYKVKSSG